METKEEKIRAMLNDILEGTDIFLVDFKVKKTNNYKIFIDSDSGLQLEKCIGVNRKLRNQIDELDFYPEGDYSLEISSPGVDEPLKMMRQYKKNIGRKLEVVLLEEDALPIEGRLTALDEIELTLEIDQKKTTEKKIEKILFNHIKSATVLIEF